MILVNIKTLACSLSVWPITEGSVRPGCHFRENGNSNEMIQEGVFLVAAGSFLLTRAWFVLYSSLFSSSHARLGAVYSTSSFFPIWHIYWKDIYNLTQKEVNNWCIIKIYKKRYYCLLNQLLHWGRTMLKMWIVTIWVVKLWNASNLECTQLMRASSFVANLNSTS